MKQIQIATQIETPTPTEFPAAITVICRSLVNAVSPVESTPVHQRDETAASANPLHGFRAPIRRASTPVPPRDGEAKVREIAGRTGLC